jgi:hypothetical protein
MSLPQQKQKAVENNLHGLLSIDYLYFRNLVKTVSCPAQISVKNATNARQDF